MIPAFISKDLAQRILVIGKSINFIRHCCDDAEWVAAAHDAHDRRGDNDADDEYRYAFDLQEGLVGARTRAERLSRAISTVEEKTNKRLLSLMFDKHGLLRHLRALKEYILLGRGDFIAHLMDLVSPQLAQPANKVWHTTSYRSRDSYSGKQCAVRRRGYPQPNRYAFCRRQQATLAGMCLRLHIMSHLHCE